MLFLDELGEFARSSLEALRQPLESGSVTIARAGAAVRFPASFQLIAAANPCGCGHGESSPACRCSPEQVSRYRSRLSGALSDRLDITLRVAQPGAAALAGDPGESSEAVRGRVKEARERQRHRLGGGRTNSEITDEELRGVVELEAAGERALAESQRRFSLSGRGWARALRLARTCADLAGCARVGEAHVAQALTLRAGGGDA